MFRSRGDTSRISTKRGLGEVQRGPGWIWPGPKVAVLCRAVNKKRVTFEGGVQERIFRGSERGTQEGVHNQVQDEIRENDIVRKDDDQKRLKVKTQI